MIFEIGQKVTHIYNSNVKYIYFHVKNRWIMKLFHFIFKVQRNQYTTIVCMYIIFISMRLKISCKIESLSLSTISIELLSKKKKFISVQPDKGDFIDRYALLRNSTSQYFNYVSIVIKHPAGIVQINYISRWTD